MGENVQSVTTTLDFSSSEPNSLAELMFLVLDIVNEQWDSIY